MQFIPYEPNIEVSGETVASTLDGFKAFSSIGKKYLEKHKLLGGGQQLDRKKWYPLDGWLKVLQDVSREVGANAMFAIGEAIPGKSVPMPPMAKDIFSSLVALDIGYHMNHRKAGQIMFNPATGKMTSGIGNYLQKPMPGENKVIVEASNPYDCDFDRGLISALAAYFVPRSKVSHDDRRPCRKNGADSCTYLVTW